MAADFSVSILSGYGTIYSIVYLVKRWDLKFTFSAYLSLNTQPQWYHGLKIKTSDLLWILFQAWEISYGKTGCPPCTTCNCKTILKISVYFVCFLAAKKSSTDSGCYWCWTKTWLRSSNPSTGRRKQVSLSPCCLLDSEKSICSSILNSHIICEMPYNIDYILLAGNNYNYSHKGRDRN